MLTPEYAINAYAQNAPQSVYGGDPRYADHFEKPRAFKISPQTSRFLERAMIGLPFLMPGLSKFFDKPVNELLSGNTPASVPSQQNPPMCTEAEIAASRSAATMLYNLLHTEKFQNICSPHITVSSVSNVIYGCDTPVQQDGVYGKACTDGVSGSMMEITLPQLLQATALESDTSTFEPASVTVTPQGGLDLHFATETPQAQSGVGQGGLPSGSVPESNRSKSGGLFVFAGIAGIVLALLGGFRYSQRRGREIHVSY